MLKRVAVVVLDGVAAFELGVLCEVFGTDRVADGFPGYDFQICTPGARAVRSASGWTLNPTADLGPVEQADLVAVPAHPLGCAAPPELAEALRRAADRGAYVLSVCSGAFVLGEAGLLDGRRCTTHWKHADELARRFPRADVDPNVLYVADDNILTSAGTAAGIDLCLHLVRREHGSAIAVALARRMVVPPHRDGGQAQYVAAPVARTPDAPTLQPLLSWLVETPRPTGTPSSRWRRATHVAAYVRPPVPRRDRRHAARLADRAARTAGPATAGGDRSRGGRHRHPLRLRYRRDAAPPLHQAGRRDPAAVPQHVPRPGGVSLGTDQYPTAAAVGPRLAARHVPAAGQPPDRLAEPERRRAGRGRDHGDPVPAAAQVRHDGRIDARLDLYVQVAQPLPARPVQRRLRIQPAVHGGQYELDVALRLHVPAHHAERPDPAPRPGSGTRE